MSVVRKAAVTTHNPGLAADVIRAWREYFCRGTIGQFLNQAPRQTQLNVIVDRISLHFRPSGFAYDTVVLLTCPLRTQYPVVFFDQALYRGKGGFLPATVNLDTAERSRLGGRRSLREQFVAELVTAARAHQPKESTSSSGTA